jgi:hypothetical protein
MSRVELTKKWWNTNRPKDVKGPELEKALAAVEQCEGESRVAALAAVPGVIARVSKGLDKKAQKDLLKSLDDLSALAVAEAKKALAEAKAQAEAASKAKAESPVKDEEETPEDKLFDPDFLRNVLKRAIRMPLVFAFAIGSKPEQCALALNVRGNPKNLLRLAKARSGSPRGCCGHAQAAEDDPKTLTLSLEGPLVSGVARTLRRYFQAQKITVFRKIRVLVDGEEAETDTGEEETPAEAASASASAATSGGPPEPPTAQEMEALEDRRREFKKARAGWVAVKIKAEVDLEKVKDGARTAYLADAKQFPKIVQGCKDIDSILDNLDDALRDTLDQYASTSLKNQNKLRALAATAVEILDRYRTYVAGNEVMKAIDMKEFADVTVHAPVMKALDDLRRSLS